MTQTTNTIEEIYAAVGMNRPARAAIREILHNTSIRPRRVAGRAYTTAREVERVERATARRDAAILAFIKAVQTAKTEARVQAAIVTLKNRTSLLNSDTSPTELATAIRNA